MFRRLSESTRGPVRGKGALKIGRVHDSTGVVGVHNRQQSLTGDLSAYLPYITKKYIWILRKSLAFAGEGFVNYRAGVESNYPEPFCLKLDLLHAFPWYYTYVGRAGAWSKWKMFVWISIFRFKNGTLMLTNIMRPWKIGKCNRSIKFHNRSTNLWVLYYNIILLDPVLKSNIPSKLASES